jgi:hypothetical protein
MSRTEYRITMTSFQLFSILRQVLLGGSKRPHPPVDVCPPSAEPSAGRSVAFGRAIVIQAPEIGTRIMRYELADFEWAAIKPMLPNKPRGVPRVNDGHEPEWLERAETVSSTPRT